MVGGRQYKACKLCSEPDSKKRKKKKKEDYNLGNCLCIRGVVVKPHINCSVSSEGKTTLLEIRESFW